MTFSSLGGPGTSVKEFKKLCYNTPEQGSIWSTGLKKNKKKPTEDVDSDIDMFLSKLVFGSDSVTSRVCSQAHGNSHNRCSVCGFNLKNASR